MQHLFIPNCKMWNKLRRRTQIQCAFVSEGVLEKPFELKQGEELSMVLNLYLYLKMLQTQTRR